MAMFERPQFRMHYEIIPGVVEMDTLLIHGNLASNVWWEPSIAVWKSKAMERGGKLSGSLIVAEWRGCGASSGPATEADLEMPVLADDYVQLLHHLKVKKANVIGHSTGGTIALLAMAQEPNLFNKAVLLDPASPKGITLSHELLAAMEAMRTNRELCSQVMASTIQGCETASPLFHRFLDSAMGMHPINWKGVTSVLGRTRLLGKMAAVNHPILVLHGEQDAIIPLADCEELVAALKHGKLQRLSGHGHSCNVEDPAKFVDIATNFLN